MTILLAGMWELGWNTPIKEIELWEYPLRDFGVDKLLMAPVSGIESNFVEEFNSIQDILDSYSGMSLVFVDERGDVPLQEFKHPENALYIFGKASQSALPYKNPRDYSVVIPTIESKGMLWPHQAAALVLYDRMLKQWP
jgi:tRNA(Leu) C34 or U34 (ribose-2'-O)-methylase TrmL